MKKFESFLLASEISDLVLNTKQEDRLNSEVEIQNSETHRDEGGYP